MVLVRRINNLQIPPAMHAVRRQAITPEVSARIAIVAMSCLRVGIIRPMPPI